MDPFVSQGVQKMEVGSFGGHSPIVTSIDLIPSVVARPQKNRCAREVGGPIPSGLSLFNGGAFDGTWFYVIRASDGSIVRYTWPDFGTVEVIYTPASGDIATFPTLDTSGNLYWVDQQNTSSPTTAPRVRTQPSGGSPSTIFTLDTATLDPLIGGPRTWGYYYHLIVGGMVWNAYDDQLYFSTSDKDPGGPFNYTTIISTATDGTSPYWAVSEVGNPSIQPELVSTSYNLTSTPDGKVWAVAFGWHFNERAAYYDPPTFNWIVDPVDTTPFDGAIIGLPGNRIFANASTFMDEAFATSPACPPTLTYIDGPAANIPGDWSRIAFIGDDPTTDYMAWEINT